MRLLEALRDPENRTAYFLIAPAIIILIAFWVVPVAMTFYMSLHRWPRIPAAGYQKEFVGLQNYTEVLRDKQFWAGVRTVLLYSSVIVPIGIFFPLLLAILLHQSLRGVSIFRTLYYAPLVTSVVSVALIWTQLYDTQNGWINGILSSLGMGKVDWLGGSMSFILAVAIMMLWKTAGFNMVLYLAALGNIDPSLYAAAEVDGASRWGKFRHVTLPALRPVMFFIILTSVIGALQAFGEFQVLAKNPSGGPVTEMLGEPVRTNPPVVYIWQVGFTDQIARHPNDLGYAAAMSFCVFVLILILTVILMRVMRRWGV
jgi:multiple sugar transport system permease protein